MRGQIEVEGVGNELMEAIRKDDSRDEQVLQELGKRNPYWTKERNVLLYKDWSMFHPLQKLRTKVIEAHHNTPLAGHPGIAKTLELINRNYWWPSMKEIIQHYVKTCVVCQRTKTFPPNPQDISNRIRSLRNPGKTFP